MRPRIGILIAVLLGPLSVGAAPVPPAGTLSGAVDTVRRQGCAEAPAADLRRLSAEPPPTGPRAAYVLGHCLRELRRPSAAREAFGLAIREHPTLGGHARLHAAAIALAEQDVEAVILLLSSLPAAASPDVRRRAALLRAEAFLRVGRAAEAAAVLRDAPLRGAEDEVQAEIWWRRGQAALAAGDRAAARRAYATAWWAYPGSAREREALEALRTLTSAPEAAIPPTARIARGRRLLAQGERRQAEREFALAVRERLPEDVAAQAWYELGLLRLRSPAAVEAFTRAAQLPDLRERALYYLGVAYDVAGRRRDALRVWEGLAARRSPWAARAFAALGRGAESREQWAEADRWYERADAVAPRAPSSDEARWRRGWIRYRTGRYAEAEQLFLRYAGAHPATPRAAAHLYWAARARLEQRQDATGLFRAVATRYPLTFYGQRARARLGLPGPAKRPPAPDPALPADLFVETHRELAALGFPAEAAREWEGRRGEEPSAAWLRTSAELWAQAGDVRQAVSAAEPLITPVLYGGRGADLALWTIAYPRAFWPELRATAERHGVDPYLALAIMREESRFDPQAVSPARAVGLMQLLPSTAAGIVGGGVTPSRLMDPDLNIRAGVAYLGGLLRRYDGSVPLAVAAYNAGPGGVRGVAALARTDVDRFVESLPYAETRTYVQRVLQSYGIYRWLYE